jgi:hypothetical protein
VCQLLLWLCAQTAHTRDREDDKSQAYCGLHSVQTVDVDPFFGGAHVSFVCAHPFASVATRTRTAGSLALTEIGNLQSALRTEQSQQFEFVYTPRYSCNSMTEGRRKPNDEASNISLSITFV